MPRHASPGRPQGVTGPPPNSSASSNCPRSWRASPTGFEGHFASGLLFLRDHCLDTGEVAAGDTPHALALLAELRGRAPAPHAAPELAAAA